MARAVSDSTGEIGLLKLTLIASAFVLTIRNLPILAATGMEQIVLCVVAVVMFLLPTALVSAELATGWPMQGGVYAWVKEAFGERWGFVAIWLQWVQMPFGMVAVLSFVGAGIAFVFDSSLADNGVFLVGVIVVAYWALTLFNFRGMQMSGAFSSFAVTIGAFIPAVVLIGFGVAYLVSGQELQVSLSLGAGNYLPSFGDMQSLALMGAIIFIFSGMETSAAHANEVRDPQRNYPIAIGIAAVVLLVVNLAGGLSVAFVVPVKDLSLVSGIFQALEDFMATFHVSWLVPILSLMIVVGGIGQVSTWIVGPVKGLLSTADNGDIPPVFQKVNDHGIPTHLLIAQASFVTVIALVFLVVGVNAALLIVLNALIMIYCLMYILMFLAGLKLRYSEPDTPRPYRVAGSRNVGMWIAAVFGILTSLFVIFIGFEPPDGLSVSVDTFRMIVGTTFVVLSLVPFVIWALRRSDWKKTANPEEVTNG